AGGHGADVEVRVEHGGRQAAVFQRLDLQARRWGSWSELLIRGGLRFQAKGERTRRRRPGTGRPWGGRYDRAVLTSPVARSFTWSFFDPLFRAKNQSSPASPNRLSMALSS